MDQIFTLRSALLALLMAVCSISANAGKGDHKPRFGGVVVESKVGDLEIYSPLDREILEIICKFSELGIDVRNLKRWKQSAESEVSLYEGRIKPFFMQKNPSSKAQAEEMLDDLIELGEQLRSTLVEVAARSFRGNR